MTSNEAIEILEKTVDSKHILAIQMAVGALKADANLEQIKENRYNQGYYDGYKHATEMATAVINQIKLEIDEKSDIHPDGEFYIKNIDVKRIIERHVKD